MPWVLGKSITLSVVAETSRSSARPRPTDDVTWARGGPGWARMWRRAFSWAWEGQPGVAFCWVELPHLDVRNWVLQPRVFYEISRLCLTSQVLQTYPRTRCPQHTVTWVSVCSSVSVSPLAAALAGGRCEEGVLKVRLCPSPPHGPAQPIGFLVTGILGSPTERET